ncbi:type I-C CRISPR-associated endonuclease Cas1 [Spiractinospora alimapuensis]|uniref:type I-C CRISPR-associated endonuclease Cas1c n=1 Tax=Spiractinospora alimapuensis TaxID=2820884 RepID=UPI001F1CBDE5|nr:type I-C CRISPR-associated endonuclease Cas1c [Spiractinospora alimapuensis]QVQ53392.1 type I-C CRISPR-associated endonuclease Cas1 [Spiractinospora alimapuensis]
MTELLNSLYIQTPGASLHLEHDAVRVRIPDDDQRRTLPLRRLDAIVVYGHVHLSTELLSRCADDGRDVVWMSAGGRFRSRLQGPVRGNVLLRHAQHLTHADLAARLRIARSIIAGKIQNSRQILLKGARDTNTATTKTELRDKAATCADYLAESQQATDLDQLMGWEGKTAEVYYTGLALLLNPNNDTGPLVGRSRRPPRDPVNSLLSFLYGLTRSHAHGALEQVGLDPYVGFLHGIRPGKPSLALDLMEEFRPVLADRLAVTLLNRKQIRAEHFEYQPPAQEADTVAPAGDHERAVHLTEDGRKIVLSEWQQWKQRQWRHKQLKRDVPAALLPVVQSRILARHLRGELPDYLPWSPT